jgi:hypothetical protein
MIMMTTRRPNGTFINSPGRTRGARNRLTVRVFEDVLAHWNEPATPRKPGGALRGRKKISSASHRILSSP